MQLATKSNPSAKEPETESPSLPIYVWALLRCRLKPEEYTGGTFTISNLGMNDAIDQFTAIVRSLPFFFRWNSANDLDQPTPIMYSCGRCRARYPRPQRKRRKRLLRRPNHEGPPSSCRVLTAGYHVMRSSHSRWCSWSTIHGGTEEDS